MQVAENIFTIILDKKINFISTDSQWLLVFFSSRPQTQKSRIGSLERQIQGTLAMLDISTPEYFSLHILSRSRFSGNTGMGRHLRSDANEFHFLSKGGCYEMVQR
jgi:hypothetical protein